MADDRSPSIPWAEAHLRRRPDGRQLPDPGPDGTCRPRTERRRAARLGDSLAVELPALTRSALVRIQVPQPSALGPSRYLSAGTAEPASRAAAAGRPDCMFGGSAKSERGGPHVARLCGMRPRQTGRPAEDSKQRPPDGRPAHNPVLSERNDRPGTQDKFVADPSSRLQRIGDATARRENILQIWLSAEPGSHSLVDREASMPVADWNV